LVVALGASAVACGGSSTPTMEEICKTASYAQCSISDSACVTQIFTAVACMRGAASAMPPPIRTIVRTSPAPAW